MTIASRAVGLLEVLELARPDARVAGRQRHLLGDDALGLGDVAAEVAAGDVDEDPRRALRVLAADHRRAGIDADVGELAERDLRAAHGVGTSTSRSASGSSRSSRA